MGSRCTERPPDPVLYGGRPSGSFVNRAVSCYFLSVDSNDYINVMPVTQARYNITQNVDALVVSGSYYGDF